MKHGHHKIITHKWIAGTLEVVETVAESLDQALWHIEQLFCSSAKVYNHEGELVHHHGENHCDHHY